MRIAEIGRWALAIAMLAPFAIVPPLVASYVAWRYALRRSRPTFGVAVLAFVVGAACPLILYGHAGPVPAVLLALGNVGGQRTAWLACMAVTGLLCAVAVLALARREHSR